MPKYVFNFVEKKLRPAIKTLERVLGIYVYPILEAIELKLYRCCVYPVELLEKLEVEIFFLTEETMMLL